MKNIKSVLALSAVCCLVLVGCSGGSSSSETPVNSTDDQTNTSSENDQSDTGTGDESNANENVLIGIFIDSAIEGASYSTETQSGMTNSAGEFTYLAGENVTFSIGNLQFPTVVAKSQVSPVDLAFASNDPDSTTTNIARLLQTLDSDGNPDNGIAIPAQATDSAAQLDFDVPVTDFESDTVVINLVANSGSVNTSIVSTGNALEHLNSSLGTNIAVSQINGETLGEDSNDATGLEGLLPVLDTGDIPGAYEAFVRREDGVDQYISVVSLTCDGARLTDDMQNIIVSGTVCVTIDATSMAEFLPEQSIIDSGFLETSVLVGLSSTTGMLGSSSCRFSTDQYFNCPTWEVEIITVESLFQLQFNYRVWDSEGKNIVIDGGTMNVFFN